jgi:hypothetical protein
LSKLLKKSPKGGKIRQNGGHETHEFTINPMPSHGGECRIYYKKVFLWEDPMFSGRREDFPILSSKDIQGLVIVSASFSEFSPETLRRGTLLPSLSSPQFRPGIDCLVRPRTPTPR